MNIWIKTNVYLFCLFVLCTFRHGQFLHFIVFLVRLIVKGFGTFCNSKYLRSNMWKEKVYVDLLLINHQIYIELILYLWLCLYDGRKINKIANYLSLSSKLIRVEVRLTNISCIHIDERVLIPLANTVSIKAVYGSDFSSSF